VGRDFWNSRGPCNDSAAAFKSNESGFAFSGDRELDLNPDTRPRLNAGKSLLTEMNTCLPRTFNEPWRLLSPGEKRSHCAGSGLCRESRRCKPTSALSSIHESINRSGRPPQTIGATETSPGQLYAKRLLRANLRPPGLVQRTGSGSFPFSFFLRPVCTACQETSQNTGEPFLRVFCVPSMRKRHLRHGQVLWVAPPLVGLKAVARYVKCAAISISPSSDFCLFFWQGTNLLAGRP